MHHLPDLVSDPYVSAFPEHTPFWKAAASGSLLLPSCGKCLQTHWYPRPICPYCHADAIEWVAACGDAWIYSYSVILAKTGPYILAYVRLAEGPYMMTNILSTRMDDLNIDEPVRLAFRRAAEGRYVPVFKRLREEP